MKSAQRKTEPENFPFFQTTNHKKQ